MSGIEVVVEVRKVRMMCAVTQEMVADTVGPLPLLDVCLIKVLVD